MHEFCQMLQDAIPDILTDEFAANAVATSFDEILTKDQSNHPKIIFGRVLEIVLNHPIISSRFRRFISTDSLRGSQHDQADLPSLQELFDTLRLIKNAIILKNPITLDDVAAAVYAQSNSDAKLRDATGPATDQGTAK